MLALTTDSHSWLQPFHVTLVIAPPLPTQALFQSGDVEECLPHFRRSLQLLGNNLPEGRIGGALQLVKMAARQLLHKHLPRMYLGRRRWVTGQLFAACSMLPLLPLPRLPLLSCPHLPLLPRPCSHCCHTLLLPLCIGVSSRRTHWTRHAAWLTSLKPTTFSTATGRPSCQLYSSSTWQRKLKRTCMR